MAFRTYKSIIIISHLPASPFAASTNLALRNVANELRATERGSGRVVIAIGHRAVGAGEEILRLAERLAAPVLTRLDAILGTAIDMSQNMMVSCERSDSGVNVFFWDEWYNFPDGFLEI